MFADGAIGEVFGFGDVELLIAVVPKVERKEERGSCRGDVAGEEFDGFSRACQLATTLDGGAKDAGGVAGGVQARRRDGFEDAAETRGDAGADDDHAEAHGGDAGAP